MKVKNSTRYFYLCETKLIAMQESDFPDIDITSLGKMCLNLGRRKEFEDEDNYTLRDLITLLLEDITKEE